MTAAGPGTRTEWSPLELPLALPPGTADGPPGVLLHAGVLYVPTHAEVTAGNAGVAVLHLAAGTAALVQLGPRAATATGSCAAYFLNASAGMQTLAVFAAEYGAAAGGSGPSFVAVQPSGAVAWESAAQARMGSLQAHPLFDPFTETIVALAGQPPLALVCARAADGGACAAFGPDSTLDVSASVPFAPTDVFGCALGRVAAPGSPGTPRGFFSLAGPAGGAGSPAGAVLGVDLATGALDVFVVPFDPGAPMRRVSAAPALLFDARGRNVDTLALLASDGAVYLLDPARLAAGPLAVLPPPSAASAAAFRVSSAWPALTHSGQLVAAGWATPPSQQAVGGGRSPPLLSALLTAPLQVPTPPPAPPPEGGGTTSSSTAGAVAGTVVSLAVVGAAVFVLRSARGKALAAEGAHWAQASAGRLARAVRGTEAVRLGESSVLLRAHALRSGAPGAPAGNAA